MEKFNKVLKIVFACLLGATFISLALCYCIIPERTKLAMDVVVSYINTPLGIAGGTLTIGGLITTFIVKYVVLANQNKIKSALSEAKSFVEKQKQEAKEYEDKGKEYFDKAQLLVSSYQEQVNEVYACVSEICATIPNKKVNALGEKMNETKENAEKELSKDLELVENLYEENKESGLKIYQEFENKLEELSTKLERLEEEYGEREETIDCDTKEE